ncbi:MAG: hypothetical protein IJ557_02395 [Bacteroidaceae bacterium]|nr:hypothetical protein [Bacteroidaceae bacterium]
MAETIYDLNNKITNKGATAQGRLSSDEFNLLVNTTIDTVYAQSDADLTEYEIDGTITI